MSDSINPDIVEKPLAVTDSQYGSFSEAEKMALRVATWEQFARASESIAAPNESTISSPSIAQRRSQRSKVTKAIFPVAGLGTRFLPATKSIPKEVMTLVDRPLIQYAVDEARAAGIKKFVFVTSRGKSALEDYFDHAPVLEAELRNKGKTDLADILAQTNMDSGSIAYVRQHKALGLGHAVWCAKDYINSGESFAVILPDDVIAAEKPCLAQMMEAHEETGGSMVAAMEVHPERTSSYGILDFAEASGQIVSVKGLIEKPRIGESPSNLAILGRYILSSSVLDNLNSVKPGVGGEIQLTDAIAKEIELGNAVSGFRFRGQRFDCGSKSGFIQATIAFALARQDLNEEIHSFLNDVFALSNETQVQELRNVINMYDYHAAKTA